MNFEKTLFSVFAGAVGLMMQSCGGSGATTGVGNDVYSYDDFDIEEIKQFDGDDYNFIFLSNDNPDCLVSRIIKAEVTDNRIYILNGMRATDTRLLAFDLDGNPVGPIGTRGQGPEEFARMSDFYVGSDGNINLYCIEKELKFDPDGNFISSQNVDKSIRSAVELPDGSLLVSIEPWDVSDAANCSLVRTDVNYNLIDSIMPKDESYDSFYGSGSGFVVPNRNGEYVYNGNYNNYIYVLNSDAKIKHVINLDFGSSNISASLKLNPDNEAQLKQCRYLCGRVYYCDDSLRFCLHDKSSSRLVELNLKDKTGRSVEVTGPFMSMCGYYNGYPILDYSYYEADMIDVDDTIRQKIDDEDLYFIALHK